MKLLILASCVVGAAAHGAVIYPPPRNAVDRDLAPWNGAPPCEKQGDCPSVETKTGWCPAPDRNGKASGENAQACFWFSNGCAVGCPACDGNSRGPIPRGGTPQVPPTGTGNNKVGPNGVVCNASESTGVKPTVCAKELRTINTDAECGADDDWYFYSPWRAPGAAPVFDSCGMAGGHAPPDGGFGGIYVNTTHAKLGDAGTKVLPERPTGVTWQAGKTYEVSWAIEANHAGGYLYRLAPADGPLTEETFNKLPLPFVGQQAFRWRGGWENGGEELWFNGTYVSEGTVPAGSTWVTNPVPRDPTVPNKCTDPAMCHGMIDGSTADPTLEIVDRVRIPADTAPGQYVLGWRWDCEESNQIWQSCSDVTIA
eukprot:g2723.t1